SCSGGSVIVAPDLEVLAGPAGSESTVLYADLDIERVVRSKLVNDFAGHYNRSDLFELRVHTDDDELVTGEGL
ncbi:MAG: hypothetical protein R3324_13370, partial [Halobacteriales archaeon]|nr:hypothetical protein [Halobacteriales archaeon]